MTPLSYADFAYRYPEATLHFLKWAAEEGFDVDQVLEFDFRVYGDVLYAYTPGEDEIPLAEFRNGEWEYELPHQVVEGADENLRDTTTNPGGSEATKRERTGIE